jgi:hypothetical protein
MADNYEMVDNKLKSKTHSKKFSEIPENFKNTDNSINAGENLFGNL